MDAIQLFAKNFAGIKYEDLPRDVVEVAKKEKRIENAKDS